MTEEISTFHSDFVGTVENAQRFCYAARARELQLEAIEELKDLKRRAKELKAAIVCAGIEDLANRMLSYEKALQAICYELEMWVALKEDRGDAAWDALVEAQNSARMAMRAHGILNHLWGYIKRLRMLETLLFPPIAFVSAGILIKRSTCSICGEEYGECSHVKGRVYMGEFCAREIHDAHLLETSIVDEPANRHCRITGFTDDGIMRDALTWRVITESASNLTDAMQRS